MILRAQEPSQKSRHDHCLGLWVYSAGSLRLIGPLDGPIADCLGTCHPPVQHHLIYFFPNEISESQPLQQCALGVAVNIGALSTCK